jgi:insertion element IS1 protein InsB
MELVEKLHRERVSQRGIARVNGISRPTIIRWLRKKVLRPIGTTILPTATRPEIEIDEQWSYVGNKGDVVWHWVAVEHSTRRVVGWTFGDRSTATCRTLWESLPADYRKRGIFTIPTSILSIDRSCLRHVTVRVRKDTARPARLTGHTTRFASGAPIWYGKRYRSVEMSICIPFAFESSLMPTTLNVQASGSISNEARDALLQAEQATLVARSARAWGLIAQARAQLARYEMKMQQVPNQEIEKDYLEATHLLKSEPDALREIAYDQVGFARDISVIYRNQGDLVAALRYQQQALSIIDEALQMLTEQPSIHRVDGLQNKSSVLNEMRRYEQADVLDQAEAMMHEAMPEYVQVVCGKVTLQRACIALYHDNGYVAALQLLAIALARVYTFAAENRDQITFEHLVQRWARDIPEPELRSFQHATHNEHIYIAACDLPYQQPHVARWADFWERSIHFLQNL